MSGTEGNAHMWSLIVSCLYTVYLSNVGGKMTNSSVRECQIVEWDASDSLPNCTDNIVWDGLRRKSSAVKEAFQAQHEIILIFYEGKLTKDAETSKGI